LNPNINLDEFHEIVQIVMGWENYHLYGYTINKKHYLPSEAAFSNICTDELILKDVMESNKKFIYEYGMGDSWKHEIVFNKYIEPKKDMKYLICTSGKGICPLEDIGGVWGVFK